MEVKKVDETDEIATPALGRAKLGLVELPSSIGVLVELNRSIGLAWSWCSTSSILAGQVGVWARQELA